MNGKNDRASMRLSATLLVAGQLLYIVVTQFHADGEAWVLSLAWMIWLVVVARRMPDSDPP